MNKLQKYMCIVHSVISILWSMVYFLVFPLNSAMKSNDAIVDSRSGLNVEVAFPKEGSGPILKAITRFPKGVPAIF